MTYDHAALARYILSRLQEHPRCSLNSVCRDLKISRHTAELSLQKTAGKIFKQIQKEETLRAIDSVLTTRVSATLKEIAFQTGFPSATSLAGFLKRSTGATPVSYCKTRRRIA